MRPNLELLEQAPLTERPSDRWRNRFHSERETFYGNGQSVGPGEWTSPNVWPSKDVAEKRAIEDIAKYRDWVVKYGVRYLGAEPVE